MLASPFPAGCPVGVVVKASARRRPGSDSGTRCQGAAARSAEEGKQRKSKGSKGGGAGAKKSEGIKGREAKEKHAAMAPQHQKQAKVAAMREFAQDERLLFTGVAAGKDAIRCIYAFPNEYTVGICSLGYQLVWAHLAASPGVHVARLFTDASEPLPRDPHLVGFSLSWELDYRNVMALLAELGVPPRAADRGDSDCLVFGGGAVLSANPEPYTDFFDVILLGDGETLLDAFLEAFQATRGGQGSRLDRLQALAQVPGVYVPCLYEVEYAAADGPIVAIRPLNDGVPASVTKQTYRGKDLAASTVVSKRMAWENIFMVEVVRSCPEMCRFCLASYGSLPFRSASLESGLIPSIERGLQETDRLGLLGASVTQHPEFNELLAYVLQPRLAHVRLSIASVRTNTVTPLLAEALAKRGTKSLTVAVESGSEKMRRIVNKKLETEEILAAAANAQQGGLEGLKLYGMVGLPGEEEEDIEATVELMKAVRKAAPGLRLTLGCSTFVPKAQTPFQWYGVRKEGERRLEYLAKAMRAQGVEFRPESYKWSVIQALLSRGDRRLGRLLEKVSEYGDSHGSFRRAFKELEGTLPPMDYYVHREASTDVLPWAVLRGTLTEATLVKHAADAAAHFSEPKTLIATP